MSLTLAGIRTVTRALLSEPTAAYWSDSELNTYINLGLEEFCSRTDCLETISTRSFVQYQGDYTLPSNFTAIKRVEVRQANTVSLAAPASLDQAFEGIVRTVSSPMSMASNIWEGNLRFTYLPNAAAASTTLNGAITSSATSITLTSGASFPRNGRILVGSEVIVFWNNSSNVLSPCERGAEGTTAASASTLATVTNRDIWIYHYKKESLSADTDTPTIPSQFQQAPAYYAAALGRRKSKDYDLATEYSAKYEELVAKAYDWGKYRWRRVYQPS